MLKTILALTAKAKGVLALMSHKGSVHSFYPCIKIDAVAWTMCRPLNSRSGQEIEFPDFSGHLGRVQPSYPQL